MIQRSKLAIQGVSVICYADDTLVLARRSGFDRMQQLIELGLACVVAAIGRPGRMVAPYKSKRL